MTKNIALHVENLGKKYRLGGPQEKYHTIRDAITNTLKKPFRALSHNTKREEFWALDDVSFDVEQGEIVGIIGRNGAGKSTLLKVLSRITSPTTGRVEIFGRVGSLLEVGTGFHPEMTGRENIFLNGSILGMKKAEIEDKFDEIVNFAEVEKFIDTPVKRFSSGMYVRLAFAVAAHLDSDILLVDEVLAVGDATFQKKCLGKMGDVARMGRTILFVSHNMTAVKALCQRGIVLESGRISYQGEIKSAVDLYLNDVVSALNTSSLSDKKRNTHVSLRAKMLDIKLFSNNLELKDSYDSKKSLEIQLKIQVFSETQLACQIQIRNQYHTIILLSSELEQNKIFDVKPGLYTLSCKLDPLYIVSGKYWITCGLARGPHEWIDYVYDAYFFEVKELDVYQNGFNLSQINAVFHVDHEWEIADAS